MAHNLPASDPLLPYEAIFVARQPIFDRDHRIWGYELLFRHSGEASTAMVTNQDMATSKVIADGFSLAMAGVDEELRALINFPARLLLDDTALALPKSRVVVEILESVQPTKGILASCRRLKDAGYLLALDDFVGQPGCEPLIELADIVKVEVLDMSPKELARVTALVKGHGRRLLAEKVEDKDMLGMARNFGYELFQGYYFSRPEIVPGRKIPAAMVAKVQLLRTLSKRDIEFRELAEIIGHDVSLSYRLLKFVNSSAFCFRSKIQSISQAVTLLGLDPFRQWAMVVVMSDMDLSPKGAELTYLSLHRARFLHQLAGKANKASYPQETMFLLGLFSKLDALLGQDMAEALANMDLDEEIAAALCGKANPAQRCLELLHCVETGQWENVDAVLLEKGLDPSTCAVEYLRASTWAKDILGQAAKK